MPRTSARRALVTGAGKRVGRAISLALAESGYAIAVHYRRDPEAADELVRAIEGRGGVAKALDADLDSPEAAAGLIARASDLIGPLTLLVNNASRFDQGGFEDVTETDLLAHFRPNLIAPLLMTQAFAAAAKDLPADADPSVINILDQRVLRPNPQFFSYTLSKCALHTATLTLAQALAPAVRVNGLAPGPTLPSTHQAPETFAAEIAGVLLQRPAATEDLASAAVYLAGARSVTGTVIVVDAGQHLGWRTPDLAGSGG